MRLWRRWASASPCRSKGRRDGRARRRPLKSEGVEALATVLLGWELGRGIGYARRLALVAAALARLGHRPVLALRDPAATLGSGGSRRIRDRSRPLCHRPLEAGHAPLHAGQLRRPHGLQRVRPFPTPDAAAGRLAGPSGLGPAGAGGGGIQPGPDVAAWRRVPTLLLGTPYLLPPAEEPWFPAHRPDWPAYAAPEEILTAMVEAQRQLGCPCPSA